MKNYIWTIINGRLVYAKKKGGLWYNAQTHEPLDPQPEEEGETHENH